MTLTRQLEGAGETATGVVATAGSAVTAALPVVTHVAWAVPVVGAAVAGVTLALGLIFGRKGPQQKVASTKIVDELEPQLAANVKAYVEGPRTPESQAAALANFDAAWAYLKSTAACGSPDLGDPGKRCISDRDRGGKTDWFSYYRDPIEQAAPVQSAASATALTAQGDPWAWLAVAAILGGVFL